MELDEFLQQREGLSLDFKQRITSAKKIAKTLCAFANTQGGYLLVGISDRKQVIGVDPEEEKYQLNLAARQFCQPPLSCQYTELEDEEGRTVLVVWVPESLQKPHQCLLKPNTWQVYVRQADQSLPADAKLVRQLEVLPTDDLYQLSAEEERLTQFISSRPKTTVQDVTRYLNFGKRRAQRLLVQLSRAGVIREFNHEHQPYYAV